MKCIEAETPTGSGWSTARDGDAVTAIRAKERQGAVAECLRLAAELRGTDPVRAQRLETLAADERQTAYALFGEAKQDGRPAREAGTEIAGGRK